MRIVYCLVLALLMTGCASSHSTQRADANLAQLDNSWESNLRIIKAAEAGAAAIIVSNHGGRVLGQTPASAEVLAEIADAVGGSMKIFVDGGIRTGTDVFKALALGADAVLIGRPFVPMVYGDGAQGVATYIEKIGSELRDTMAMCGVHALSEITRDCVRVL